RTASPASVRWALLTALAIGAYTTVDAHGSRISADGAAYGLALMPITAAALSVAFVVRGRSGALVELAGRSWMRWLVAGACTTAAYTLVLIAVRSAPVGYVTMLRESSVVLGALAGWLFLHERLGGRRLASSTVILAGMVLLVAAGT
ncbi:MAG: EamA family transporter, partial [Acidimicrobiales bacterium]|nr:EamA family transporter [Acidimicrobiales bacterium]